MVLEWFLNIWTSDDITVLVYTQVSNYHHHHPPPLQGKFFMIRRVKVDNGLIYSIETQNVTTHIITTNNCIILVEYNPWRVQVCLISIGHTFRKIIYHWTKSQICSNFSWHEHCLIILRFETSILWFFCNNLTVTLVCLACCVIQIYQIISMHILLSSERMVWLTLGVSMPSI